MGRDAFFALDAISKRADFAGRERWVAAFKVIRWAIETRDGVKLTSAGHKACDEMALERQATPIRPKAADNPLSDLAE